MKTCDPILHVPRAMLKFAKWARQLPVPGPLNPKVLILGTGRAGTTYIVEVLVRMGLVPRQGNGRREINMSQLMRAESWNAAPHIIKNPVFTSHLCEHFDHYHREGALEHIIVPIRDVDAIARSWANRDGVAKDIPKGAYYFAETLGRLMCLCETRGVPWSTYAFPRVREDYAYAWERLAGPLGLPESRCAEFIQTCEDVSERGGVIS